MVGNHSVEIINYWNCGSPQRTAFVTLFCICRKSSLHVTSKCCYTSPGSCIFFSGGLLYCQTTSESALKTGKLGSSAVLLLALKTVGGAECVYMQAGSLESSWCCSCTTLHVCLHHLKLCWPSTASPGRTSQGGSEVREHLPAPLMHPCKDWMCFTYTETICSGEKKNPIKKIWKHPQPQHLS